MKYFRWTARILSILAIMFVSMFAFDSFEMPTLKEQLIAFAIHLIPSYILAAILYVAWRWELIGGIIYILIALGVSPWIFKHNYAMNHSISMSLGIIGMITFPFVVSGSFFLTSYVLHQKALKNAIASDDSKPI